MHKASFFDTGGGGGDGGISAFVIIVGVVVFVIAVIVATGNIQLYALLLTASLTFPLLCPCSLVPKAL